MHCKSCKKIKILLPKIKITKKKNASVDKRSYKVKFYKLAKNYMPKKKINKTIKELIKYFQQNEIVNNSKFEDMLKRLNLLDKKIENKILNKNLDLL